MFFFAVILILIIFIFIRLMPQEEVGTSSPGMACGCRAFLRAFVHVFHGYSSRSLPDSHHNRCRERRGQTGSSALEGGCFSETGATYLSRILRSWFWWARIWFLHM